MKKSTENLLLYGGLAFAAYYLFLRPQAGATITVGGLARRYANTNPSLQPGWMPKRTMGVPGGLPGLPGMHTETYTMAGLAKQVVSPYHRSRYMAY